MKMVFVCSISVDWHNPSTIRLWFELERWLLTHSVSKQPSSICAPCHTNHRNQSNPQNSNPCRPCSLLVLIFLILILIIYDPLVKWCVFFSILVFFLQMTFFSFIFNSRAVCYRRQIKCSQPPLSAILPTAVFTNKSGLLLFISLFIIFLKLEILLNSFLFFKYITLN